MTFSEVERVAHICITRDLNILVNLPFGGELLHPLGMVPPCPTRLPIGPTKDMEIWYLENIIDYRLEHNSQFNHKFNGQSILNVQLYKSPSIRPTTSILQPPSVY